MSSGEAQFNLSEYKETYRKDPSNFDNFSNLINVLMVQKNYEQAETVCQECYEAHPDN